MSFIWLYLKINISDFRLILLDHTRYVCVITNVVLAVLMPSHSILARSKMATTWIATIKYGGSNFSLQYSWGITDQNARRRLVVLAKELRS